MSIETTGITPVARDASIGNAGAASPRPAAADSKDASAKSAVVQSAAANTTASEKKDASGGQLQFNIDNQTSQLVIQVVNGTTKEIIRKIPAEQVVEFVHTLDSATGNMIKANA